MLINPDGSTVDKAAVTVDKKVVLPTADLLAQAEHGRGSTVVLVTNSSRVLNNVQQAVENQLQSLTRKQHLREVIVALQPEWLIGIGDFAMKRAQQVFPDGRPKVVRILHPSPASPAANRRRFSTLLFLPALRASLVWAFRGR